MPGREEVPKEAVEAAWDEAGRSALDEMFEAVSPRDGSEGDPHTAAMLAPHAWAEIKRIRNQERQRIQEALEKAWDLLDKIADPIKGQPSRMHPDQTTDAELASTARQELRAALDTLDPSGEEGEETRLRERLEGPATKERLRVLFKEEGWTYLTPNSINNVLDMVVRAALAPATDPSKEERERWKVDDDYPVTATKPDGGEFVFDDLIHEGDEVGLGPIPEDCEDRDGRPPYGLVVRESDGLWIVVNTDAEERERSQRTIDAINRAASSKEVGGDGE